MKQTEISSIAYLKLICGQIFALSAQTTSTTCLCYDLSLSASDKRILIKDPSPATLSEKYEPA